MKRETADATQRESYRFLLSATFSLALAVAQTAGAAWFGWKGSASSPSYWNVQDNWYISGSNWSKFETEACNFHINPVPSGSNIFVSGWDNVITFQANNALSGPLLFCAGSTSGPVKFVAKDGSSDYGITSAKDLNINCSDNTPDPCLEILSGKYQFYNVNVANTSGRPGTLKLTGGELIGSYITAGKSGPGYIEIGDGGRLSQTYRFLTIGGAGNGTVTIKRGGTYENINGNGNVTMAYGASEGTLNSEGGTFVTKSEFMLNYDSKAKKSVVNITEGGVLTTKILRLLNAGTGGGTVTLDGGTLRAYTSEAGFVQAHANLHVYAGANGATIDAAGFVVTFAEDIEDVPGEAGTVTFKGGGTITFTGTPSHTGGTTCEAGTVLALTTAAKTALVAHPVTVEIPSGGVGDGLTVLEITDGGTFTQAEVTAMTLVGSDGGRYALALAANGAKVVISDTLAGEYVWNGGATGASWIAPGKWTKNGVVGDWYNATAAVFANAGDAATVNSDVTAASVTFRADATITGTATLFAPEVAVSDGVSATISPATSGVLEKTGPGTLTLGSSRADATTVSEGTLVLSGSGVMADWAKFTLGADAAKPVALRFENGATLASSVNDLYIGRIAGGTTELSKDGGDWDVTWNMVFADAKNATTRFYHRGGTLTLARYIRVGFNAESDSGEAYFEISGGTVTNTVSSGGGYISVGDSGKPGYRGVMTVKTGGTYGAATSFIVGYNASGTLNVEGGTVCAANGTAFICYGSGCTEGEDCAINVTDGGTMIVNAVRYGSSDTVSGTANGTLKLDNGTLKAGGSGLTVLAHDRLTLTVAEGGGTIDANGKTVTIDEAISGAGAMTYKGGGTVTLGVAPAYSGKTTVEIGTTLVVPAALAGADLVLAVPEGLATGFYKVAAVTGGGTFADDVLSTATLPEGNIRFILNEEKTEIWCAYSAAADEHVWVGGASGSLNEGANWLSGSVPAGGTAFIANLSEASLANPEGSGFGATRIVVPPDSAPVRISGAKFVDVAAVVNNSAGEVEFENAVEFAGDIDVVQNTGAVKFTGGAVGVKLARATDIHGTYTSTVTGDHTEIGGTVVKSDGVYLLPNACFFKHNADFSVEAGGRAEVMSAKINRGSEAHLLGTLDGEFKVTDEFVVTGGGGITHYTAVGNGTFVVGRIRPIQNTYIVPVDGNAKTVFGSGGILRGAGYVRVDNTGSHEFGSCADWTMCYNEPGANRDTGNFAIYKHNSTGLTTVTFDTTDYYESSVGRTITCEAPIGAANAESAAKFKVNVKGIGTFVFANTSDGAIFSGGLTAQDAATVEVLADAWPGKGAVVLEGASTLKMHTGGEERTGAVRLGSGATLEVCESGTAKVGALSLADGSTLAFNFTEAAVAPTLATGGAMPAGTVNVKLSGVMPKAKTFLLTTGGGFGGDAVTVDLADGPKGTKVKVNADGNLEVVVTVGLTIMIR